MGFDRTKDLKLYKYTQEKGEKSWVLGELKILIFIKQEEKRWSLTELKI